MTSEPQVTISILSWLLEDRLIKTLKGILKSTSMPLNLCLHIQGEEQISRRKRKEIHKAASGFAHQDIYYTPHNDKVAVPRAALLKRSARTPYVFITDNDMDFEKGSIDTLYEFLNNNDNLSYGAACLVDDTLRWHRRVDVPHRRITYFPVSLDKPKVVDVDMCGACCLMLRSGIIKNEDLIDTRYSLGTWDIDLCMNLRESGWKIATICDKRYVARNDVSYRTSKYNSVKGIIPERVKGMRLFRQKWEISSEIERDKAMGVKINSVDTAIITRSIYTSLSDYPGIGKLTKVRLNAMQKFFINSLRNQTDKDFTLYVFIGSEGNEATDAIKSLDWGDLNVKYIHTGDTMDKWQDSVDGSGNWGRENDPGCPEDIVRKIGHPKHTIMARLDNDDWVAPGWVTHMKYMSKKVNKSRFLINYQVIGQAPDGRLYRFFNPHRAELTSPFLALVQKDSPKISPYADSHLWMGKLFETVYTIQPSYAFMVISSDNRSNRVYRHDKYFEDIAINADNVSKETSMPIMRPIPRTINVQKNSWRQRILRQQIGGSQQ